MPGATQSIIWQPQPGPQTALLECPVFEIFFGGARGGGKTDGSIGDWLLHSSTYGENAIGIFVRRRLTQLSEVIARTKSLFKKLGATYNEQAKTWTMPGGGRLKFVYLEKDEDAEEYQGHSYTRVYVEEVTNFPSADPIMKLMAVLRSGAGVPCGMRLTGNPGGPGHTWVKARYIDPAPLGYKVITETELLDIDGVKTSVSIDRVFIPSRLSDNKILVKNDPTYILRLRKVGSAALVKAWLDGDWTSIDGAFFDEWDTAIHVKPQSWLARIPKAATRFRAFDWGSYRPFSVGWYVVSDGTWGLPKGAILKYREWYGAVSPNKGLKMDVPQVAQGINLREREDGWPIQYGVADPSIFIRNGGPSIAETMAMHGVTWRRGDNQREPGAEAVRQRLAGEPIAEDRHGPPMLYFLETCVDSIRTIPVLQHDAKNPEDVDTDGEDHAYDELRYACMSRPWILDIPEPEGIRYPKLPAEMTINDLVAHLRLKHIRQREAH